MQVKKDHRLVRAKVERGSINSKEIINKIKIKRTELNFRISNVEVILDVNEIEKGKEESKVNGMNSRKNSARLRMLW